ncbi:hypothetical protein AB5J62_41545 [Amycolatopsis sp. cg5]|uniref:hypothetical protein n=1 Tax=Amycolatopsis sp. cg5 TaxID=3238802 RepID=UPI0035269AB1
MKLAHLLAAAGVLFALTPALPASASTPGYCKTDDGVTVVVDFGELGGEVVVRCAPGVQRSGLAALQSAGIAVVVAESNVCRLQGKPEACDGAQWSYWNAWNGGAWAKSQRGPSSSMPPLGTFEGWSFGKAAPRFTPSRPVPTPSPTPTPRPQEHAPDPRAGGGAPVVPVPQGAPPAPPATSSAPASSSVPPPSPSPSEVALDEGAPRETQQHATQAKAAEPVEFPWLLLVGAIVVGKVIAFLLWRRKRVPY